MVACDVATSGGLIPQRRTPRSAGAVSLVPAPNCSIAIGSISPSAIARVISRDSTGPRKSMAVVSLASSALAGIGVSGTSCYYSVVVVEHGDTMHAVNAFQTPAANSCDDFEDSAHAPGFSDRTLADGGMSAWLC